MLQRIHELVWTALNFSAIFGIRYPQECNFLHSDYQIVTAYIVSFFSALATIKSSTIIELRAIFF